MKEFLRGVIIILIAAIVLSFAVTFKTKEIVYPALIGFLIIISANILTKKAVGYYFETKVKTKFWSLYQFGFRKDMHFKNPVPMVWLPLIFTLFTRGIVWWLAILEFDVEAKTERVSKRHGLYRFSEVTEWHMALIAIWGIAINLLLAIGGYLLGFELFAKLSVYFAAWSIIPLSNLDGSKIFFSSRWLWTVIAIIIAIFLGWAVAL